MSNLVIDVEQKEKFSPYPEQVDAYFLNQDIIIRTFPQEMSFISEPEFPDIHITSTKHYVDYLEQEIKFWKENDPDRKLNQIVNYQKFTNAKQQLEQALNYGQSPNNTSTVNIFLKQSLDYLKDGVIYSKTRLAAIFLQYLDRSASFLSGLRIGLLNTKSSTIPNTVDGWEGFFAAMTYKDTYTKYLSCSEETIVKFQETVKTSSENYATLNRSYTASFHEQEQRIADITQQTNTHLASMEREKNDFFNSAGDKLQALEDLYGEKLKLSEPAQYWEKIDKDYGRKGTKWLIISAILAVVIIGGLIAFLLCVPTIFSEDYHWFDNIKNSAIITVIASIAIYMLRLTVKMATSSYHLSRDAKERHNLSYFYLALIEKNAVSDKERALVLNALFSRSDTGLLKGDSAPSMPSNISDLISMLDQSGH